MLPAQRIDTWNALIEDAVAEGRSVLPEALAKALLAEAGVPVPRGVTGVGADDLLQAAELEGLREPLVLKAAAPRLLHKSDAGGVAVGLQRDQVSDEVDQMRRSVEDAGHVVSGYLLEEMAAAGVEMVVGAVRDATGRFMVMIGLGGIFIEVMEDVAFRIAPLQERDVYDMLSELRGRRLLDGARGDSPKDVHAFVEVVLRLAGPEGLLSGLPPYVQEVDLNPVLVQERGALTLDARLVLSDRRDVTPQPDHATGEDFTPLFSPASVAVLGASAKGTNPANLFIRNIRDFGFAGPIYPVHPTATRVESHSAYPSLSALPEAVDYAFVALPAAAVPGALAEGKGKVRFAQVISSGFAETPDGLGREQELKRAASAAGTRVLGPNCLGTHSPRGRLTFVEGADPAPGSVAVISQSGGLSVDILRLGTARGLRFSAVVSLGNGADVTPAELVEHFLRDPETEVVGLYLESLDAAVSVLDVVRRERCAKPVVLLAGGRTAGGARAAQSHTGALAAQHRIWPAVAGQAGMILVDSLPEMLNAMLAFQFYDKQAVHEDVDVVLFGNGGGTSVLATDALERVGLNVPLLPKATRTELEKLDLPPGTSLANPLDAPAWTLAVDEGRVARRILTTVLETTRPAIVISHFNVGIIASNTRSVDGDVMSSLIGGVAQARDQCPGAHHLLVLRPDGKEQTDELIARYQVQANKAGLPVFRELSDAAGAARALVAHERRQRPDEAK